MAQVGAPLTQLADVAYPSRRHHDDPSAAVMDSPAQLGVLAVEVDRRVEPAELAEQVGTNQQIRRRQHEHVANAVVLFLVDLAHLDDRVDLAESVHAETDGLQHVGVVPFDELRADGSRIRSVQLLDHDPQRIGFGSDVVVTDQEEAVVALDQAEHLVRGGTEADVGSDGAHERPGQALLDPSVDRRRPCRRRRRNHR